MQLTKEQQEIVDLKKWAYAQALDVAKNNASALTKESERTRVQHDEVQENANEIFRWVTPTDSE